LLSQLPFPSASFGGGKDSSVQQEKAPEIHQD
jgi:hypothetical protein